MTEPSASKDRVSLTEIDHVPSHLTVHPHIYKKGKILNFKKLNEGVDTGERYYIFSGKVGNHSLNTIVSATNNINQITGRCLLGIYDLLSYFGLSKDPSEKLSKSPSVFNKFPTFFGGENSNNKLREIKILLIQQNAKIEKLEQKMDHLSNKEEIYITSPEILNLTSKLNEIKDNLNKILG